MTSSQSASVNLSARRGPCRLGRGRSRRGHPRTRCDTLDEAVLKPRLGSVSRGLGEGGPGPEKETYGYCPARDSTEDTMTTTPDDPTTALPGRPPVVDLATWQAARDELLVREKAHTREGDAIAAARRRLPMVELGGTVEVVGPDGPVPFLDLFQAATSSWSTSTRGMTARRTRGSARAA